MTFSHVTITLRNIIKKQKETPYLLDYKLTVAKFKVGDTVLINSIINNRSDISLTQYPKKSMKFTLVVDEISEEDTVKE